MSLNKKRTLKTVKIDHAANGVNEIVAAVTGKKIKVYSVVLVVTGAVTCEWSSAANKLSGCMSFAANGDGYAAAVNPPAFLMETVAGEALNLYLGAAVAVDGMIAYWDDDTN